MKRAARFLTMAAVAVGVSLLSSTSFAAWGHGGGGFRGGGRYGGGWGWGWRGWWPGWGLGISYAYAPWPYYYNYGYYYPPAAYYPQSTYYAPAVVYGSQPADTYNSAPPQPTTESPQGPVVDRPLSPTAVDRDETTLPPPPPPMTQRPPQILRGDQGQSLGVADVKALATAGLSDDVILSHIRNSGAVYHLTTAEIIDLKKNGVSDKVIDFMINTPSAQR
jgi:hypothetical protein